MQQEISFALFMLAGLAVLHASFFRAKNKISVHFLNFSSAENS
jgi:hypothetical protein